MVLNALEATRPDGTVRVGLECREKQINFTVWNRQPIPPGYCPENFPASLQHQERKRAGSRHLFHEASSGKQFLNGLVDFSTSETEGTTFRLTLRI